MCRVRTTTCTEEDIKALESRTIKDNHPGYPNDALHVYLNHVDDHKIKLHELAPSDQHIVIKAIGCIKDKHTTAKLEAIRQQG